MRKGGGGESCLIHDDRERKYTVGTVLTIERVCKVKGIYHLTYEFWN